MRQTLPPSRRGQILPVVLGLLILLGLVAIAFLDRSSSVMLTAARDAGGAIAEELAFSAIEEASWKLQRGFTDPLDPLFTKLRETLIQGVEPSLDLTTPLAPSILPERLKTAVQNQFFKKMVIEGPQVTFHIPTHDVQHDQVVDFDCTVRMNLAGRPIYRRIFERRRYGILLVSPYKPFDRMTLAVLNHSILNVLPPLIDNLELIRLGRNQSTGLLTQLDALARAQSDPTEAPILQVPPPLIRAGTPPRRPQFLEFFVNQELNKRRQTQPGFDRFLDSMTPDERGWYEWSLIQNHPENRVAVRAETLDLDPTVDSLRADPASILTRDLPPPGTIVFSVDEEVHLEDFDYEVRLEKNFTPHETRLIRQVEQHNELWANLLNQSTGDPIGSRELLQLIEPIHARLRDHFVKSIEQINEVTAHVMNHTRIGLKATALFSYLSTTSIRLRNLGYHVSKQEDMNELFKIYPVFNELVTWGGDDNLSISNEKFSGKAIFTAPYKPNEDIGAQLVVENLRTTDPDADLVLLNANRISLRGQRVDASLFVQNGISILGKGVEINGNLIIDTLHERADRNQEEELKGTIHYNPHLSSGLIWERHSLDERPEGISYAHYVLSLCPRDLQRAILRSESESP